MASMKRASMSARFSNKKEPLGRLGYSGIKKALTEEGHDLRILTISFWEETR